MKIKLSTTLGALLVGSLLLTGCGSSSSSTTASSDSTATGPQFTTAILGGKTFYNYYRNIETTLGTTTYDPSSQLNFSADASTVEVIELSSGNNLGTAPATIDKDLLSIQANGESHPQFLIKELNGDLLLSEQGDINVWTPTQGAAPTAYDALVAGEQETVAMVTANPWYELKITYDSNNTLQYNCQDRITVDANGTTVSEYLDDNGVLQTTTGSLPGVVTAVDGVIVDDSFVAATPTAIYGNDRKISFKNRADVQRYIESDGTNSDSCMAHYPN